jgi:hypothetical protein
MSSEGSDRVHLGSSEAILEISRVCVYCIEWSVTAASDQIPLKFVTVLADAGACTVNLTP